MSFSRPAATSILALSFAGLVALVVAAGHSAGQPQSPAPGGSAASSRIAVLDLVRVFNETAQIQDLNDLIRQKNDDYAKEAKQRKKVIEDRQLELSAFKIGSQDYDTRRKNLIRLNIEANVWLKVSEQEIEQLRYDWTKIVYEKAMQASAEVARERGYDIVLQRTDFKPDEVAEPSLQSIQRLIRDRAVVYHAKEIDITDLVMQRMDREYKAAGGKATLGGTTHPAGP
jgi:Skp family chaperone for outer membrane proteins